MGKSNSSASSFDAAFEEIIEAPSSSPDSTRSTSTRFEPYHQLLALHLHSLTSRTTPIDVSHVHPNQGKLDYGNVELPILFSSYYLLAKNFIAIAPAQLDHAQPDIPEGTGLSLEQVKEKADAIANKMSATTNEPIYFAFSLQESNRVKALENTWVGRLYRGLSSQSVGHVTTVKLTYTKIDGKHTLSCIDYYDSRSEMFSLIGYTKDAIIKKLANGNTTPVALHYVGTQGFNDDSNCGRWSHEFVKLLQVKAISKSSEPDNDFLKKAKLNGNTIPINLFMCSQAHYQKPEPLVNTLEQEPNVVDEPESSTSDNNYVNQSGEEIQKIIMRERKDQLVAKINQKIKRLEKSAYIPTLDIDHKLELLKGIVNILSNNEENTVGLSQLVALQEAYFLSFITYIVDKSETKALFNETLLLLCPETPPAPSTHTQTHAP